ncbi:T6SS effector amidase Tae4 family protein [Telluria beijingensis]|uniref:T6SS effector amidase Tae4 family protein n=1 Tax=Telluria beijingensis TaxID=3068633 RepID=UPI0027960FAD|nr:T6SS effector amidase Tae4 family protein [Massilia sp. REN29]
MPAAALASQLAAWLKLQPFCGLPNEPKNVTGKDWQEKIKERTGIVYFANYWARNARERARDMPSGDHIDLWNGSRLTATGASFFSTVGRRLGFSAIGAGSSWGYSDLGRSSEILFWEIE